jgi:hypothetical protein
MSGGPIYRVVVTDNIVCAIERVDGAAAATAARDELDASTRLSRNNLTHGRLDGVYHFDDPQLAKQFAVLCLDFTKRLVERTLTRIEASDFSGELPCDDPRHGHD